MTNTNDIRPEIQADFERLYRKAVDILEQACDATTHYSEMCKCGRRVAISYPKIDHITNALKFLAEQSMGRPAAQQPATAQPEAVLGELEQLTDTELAKLAGNQTSPPSPRAVSAGTV